ncbi:hypothetical protein fh0823_22580 [Francisella halioticida]|uniref:Molybdopterin synthase sulfur carrier subunit n=1 Tax=Francisella halioticida TaxID=549298 RepID=A0ABN5AYH8_9GAMM|nr:hypothetical protein [Francisella halioticida]ASG67177.1 hypothetical protein CDV26_01160 [Francisella halioticida]BCD92119.1 hypothetical protein fh0823_22580 [Francisella halioticida]
MNYIIEVCGPAKEFYDTTQITLKANKEINSIEIKELLLQNLKSAEYLEQAESLFNSSLIATEEDFFETSKLLPNNQKLFLIPPVCGG